MDEVHHNFASLQEAYDWATAQREEQEQQTAADQALSGRDFADYVRQGVAELELYLSQR